MYEIGTVNKTISLDRSGLTRGVPSLLISDYPEKIGWLQPRMPANLLQMVAALWPWTSPDTPWSNSHPQGPANLAMHPVERTNSSNRSPEMKTFKGVEEAAILTRRIYLPNRQR